MTDTTPATKRRITAEDLYDFREIKDLTLAPDGKTVIYTLQRVDRKTEKKYTNLWSVPTDASAPPRQFTYGDQSDNSPKFSPDGTTIAFLSNRGDVKQSQIFLIPLNGGEARPLTDLKGYFSGFEWSPDGSHIAFAFTEPDPDVVEREKDPAKKELGIVSRHITRRYWKYDGAGYLPHNQGHIWVANADTGKATQLTKPVEVNGDTDFYSEGNPIWTPDGQHILFQSNRHDDPITHPDHDDFYLIPAAGGDFTPLGLPPMPKYLPSFSPNGQWIAFLGGQKPDFWQQNTEVFVVPRDLSAPPRSLTRPFDYDAGSSGLNDLPGSNTAAPPTWSPDGTRIYYQVSKHGDQTLRSIQPDGAGEKTVIDGPGLVGAYAFSKDGQTLAYFFGQMHDPGQIMAKVGNAAPQQLTTINADLLNAIDLGKVEEVWFKGPDGNDLQGWILTPPDFDPKKQYPAVLEIHGGPQAMYSNFFMHEFYYLAAHNFVVAFSNPRGGQGYGETHVQAILNGWGDRDYADLMVFTDLVEKLPYVDADRLGVTGGSYGGYMTLWIVGHTDRFKAAVAQRVVSNFITMWGASDMNWQFGKLFGAENYKAPFENLAAYWQMSPMAHMHNCKTPTKIIHSEQDLRCPIDQGEQAYTALRYMGVDAEMVIFPGESHGLSRGGRTDRRITRLNHIAGWMVKYLNPEPMPTVAPTDHDDEDDDDDKKDKKKKDKKDKDKKGKKK